MRIATLIAVAVLLANFPAAFPAEIDTTQSAPAPVEVKSVNVKPLPKRLGGPWITPDKMYRYKWFIEEMSEETKTGLLTHFSTRSGCGMTRELMRITEWDGKRLKIELAAPNGCYNSVTISLTRRDGNSDIFEGIISFDTKLPSNYTYVDTTVTP